MRTLVGGMIPALMMGSISPCMALRTIGRSAEWRVVTKPILGAGILKNVFEPSTPSFKVPAGPSACAAVR